MKFATTAGFDRDYQDLPEEHKRLVRKAVSRFHEAAVRSEANPSAKWPMRARLMSGTSGIWEMTWHFERPDLRATFEWVEIDGERAIQWRRIGDHSIFNNP